MARLCSGAGTGCPRDAWSAGRGYMGCHGEGNGSRAGDNGRGDDSNRKCYNRQPDAGSCSGFRHVNLRLQHRGCRIDAAGEDEAADNIHSGDL